MGKEMPQMRWRYYKGAAQPEDRLHVERRLRVRSAVACGQGLDAEEAAVREAANRVILHPLKEGLGQEA